MGRPAGSPDVINDFLNHDNYKVDIITLGGFDIQYQGKSLLTGGQRSYKILELLRYLITFHNKRLLPETIIDELWPYTDSKDPKNVLRAQVYRLRKLLEEMRIITKCQQDLYLDLTYSSGYYFLTMGDQCRLDTHVFENTLRYAESLEKQDSLQAIDMYRQALVLYKGEYMAGTAENEWLFPFQNRYRRIYLQALFHLLELLNSNEEYEEIITVCEEAALIEPYDETMHVYFLQALIELGDSKSALSHYNYITSFLYKELGVKPSAALRAVHRQLQGAIHSNQETDLVLIEKELTDDDDMAGALCCDIDYFRILYQTERRKSLRTDTPGFLGLITVSGLKEPLSDSTAEAVMKDLTKVLKVSLRRGDVFSRWNNNQILLLVTVQQQIDIDIIAHRLRLRFREVTGQAKVNIKLRFQPLTSEAHF